MQFMCNRWQKVFFLRWLVLPLIKVISNMRTRKYWTFSPITILNLVRKRYRTLQLEIYLQWPLHINIRQNHTKSFSQARTQYRMRSIYKVEIKRSGNPYFIRILVSATGQPVLEFAEKHLRIAHKEPLITHWQQYMFCYNNCNNIRKAKTEKSNLLESYREKNIWWKFFMQEDRWKPFQSCNAELSKCYRMTALKYRIC